MDPGPCTLERIDPAKPSIRKRTQIVRSNHVIQPESQSAGATPAATKIQLFHGDCTNVLLALPEKSVDLIVTSPPYADQRKTTYGGVHADQYVTWFSPIADGLHRVLKPSGSFVLNIKERVVEGERHTYVMELIIEMRKRGWLYTEEYIWHKRNCYPGKWPNRFRDAWERCIHFTKEKKFSMYQDAVRVPMGDWKKSRLKSLSDTDKRRDESKVGSGFGKKIENWVGRDLAYPANVLHLATECSNRSHAAAFPEALPQWFIKLFTKEGAPYWTHFQALEQRYALHRH